MLLTSCLRCLPKFSLLKITKLKSSLRFSMGDQCWSLRIIFNRNSMGQVNLHRRNSFPNVTYVGVADGAPDNGTFFEPFVSYQVHFFNRKPGILFGKK